MENYDTSDTLVLMISVVLVEARRATCKDFAKCLHVMHHNLVSFHIRPLTLHNTHSS